MKKQLLKKIAIWTASIAVVIGLSPFLVFAGTVVYIEVIYVAVKFHLISDPYARYHQPASEQK